MYVFNRPGGSIPSSNFLNTNTNINVMDARLQPRYAVALHPTLLLGTDSEEPLVDARYNSPRDKLDVAIPVLAVLPAALLLVATLTVDEQDGKVYHEEVGEDHAPALGLARDGVLSVAVLVKVRIVLSCCDGRLSGVLDEVAGHGSRENVAPAHEPVA